MPGELRRRRHRDLPGAALLARPPGRASSSRRSSARCPTTSGESYAYDALRDRDATAPWLHPPGRRRDRSGRCTSTRPASPTSPRACPATSSPPSRATPRWSTATGDPQAVPPAGARASTRTSRSTTRCGRPENQHIAPLLGPHRDRRPGPGDAAGHGRDAAGVPAQRHRRLGAGHGQRPRPVRRGRPARRRGGRRLRRRGERLGAATAVGARRPGRACCRPSPPTASWSRPRPADARPAGAPPTEVVPELGRARRRAARGCTPRWPTPTSRSSASGCTATCTWARCCARRPAGWCSTSRASRPGRWPSAGSWTPRCATWPGCCAPSTTRPGTCWSSSPTTRSAPYRAPGVGGAQPGRVLRRLLAAPAALDPSRRLAAAAGVRGRQGGLRVRLRGPQPAAWLLIPLQLADAGSTDAGE